MPRPSFPPKDPDALKDFSVDWTPWLPEGDTIISSLWIVPSGITNDHEENSTQVATIWLSGGSEGQTYQLTNRITTQQGRIDDRTVYVQVKST